VEVVGCSFVLLFGCCCWAASRKGGRVVGDNS